MTKLTEEQRKKCIDNNHKILSNLLTPEQKELLNEVNWKRELIKLSALKNPFIHIALLFEKVLEAKDLEAEQKVEEAVRNERERCALIMSNTVTLSAIRCREILEPPKE